MANAGRLAVILGVASLFGAPLGAMTWYFEDTEITNVSSPFDQASVTGYVTISPSGPAGMYAFPVDIIFTGSFGTFTDTGTGLQLDEGAQTYADDILDYDLEQALTTPGLTIDPLVPTMIATLPSGVYEGTTGFLTDVAPAPEPGTASVMLIGSLGLACIAAWKGKRTLLFMQRGRHLVDSRA